jgi:hypothetical protein
VEILVREVEESPKFISPLVLSVCDPAKIFLSSKFNYLLFGKPTHKP